MNALLIRVCVIAMMIYLVSEERTYASNPEETTICIQPLGEYLEELVVYVQRGISYFYGFETRLLPAMRMPETAYYEPRNRWKSQQIVEYLKEIKPDGCDFIQGFTDQDISITKDGANDFGVIGWANGFGGKESVVSTYRIKKFGIIDIRKLLVKTVNHEIGHMLGFRHHPKDECLMARWEPTLDHESILLCSETRSFIEKNNNLTLPVREPFNWKEILEWPEE